MLYEACQFICGFFDCEGYLYGHEYRPCEIALLSDKGACVYIVNHGLSMRKNSYQLARDISRHGIPFDNKDGIAMEEVCDLINDFYDTSKTPKRFVIAAGSAAASDVLHNLGIPYVTLLEKKGNYSPCPLHKLRNTERSCALSSVMGMMQWRLNQEDDDKLYQIPYDTCDFYAQPENRGRNFKTVEKIECQFCHKRHYET